MNLTQQITETVINFPKVTDYDQRSAIGMARTWVEKRKLDVWDPIRHKDQIQNVQRDALATALVDIFRQAEAEEDEMIAALASARAEVNRPFQHQQRPERGPLSKPGDEAKRKRDQQ